MIQSRRNEAEFECSQAALDNLRKFIDIGHIVTAEVDDFRKKIHDSLPNLFVLFSGFGLPCRFIVFLPARKGSRDAESPQPLVQ